MSRKYALMGVCPPGRPAGSTPARGAGSKKRAVAVDAKQSGSVQGIAGAVVPLSVPEIRRIFWRLELGTTQTVAKLLAWSIWRRVHQGIAKYWHYKRRAVS